MLPDESHLTLVFLWTCCIMQYMDGQVVSTKPACEAEETEMEGWLLMDYALNTVPSSGNLEFRLPEALRGADANNSGRGADPDGSSQEAGRESPAAVCTRLKVHTPRHASKITLSQLVLPLRQCEEVDRRESGQGCTDFVEVNGESRQCCIIGGGREGRVQAFNSVSAVLRTTPEVAQMTPVVRFHYEVIGCPLHALEAESQRQRVVTYSWKTAPLVYCSKGLYELSRKDGAFLSSVEVPCTFESNTWSFIPNCRNVSSQEANSVMKAEFTRFTQPPSTHEFLLGASVQPPLITVISPTAVSTTRYSSRGTKLVAGSHHELSGYCSAAFQALVMVYLIT